MIAFDQLGANLPCRDSVLTPWYLRGIFLFSARIPRLLPAFSLSSGRGIEQRDSLRIMVMYGVPTPRPERLDAQQQQQREASEVADPAVGERAGER